MQPKKAITIGEIGRRTGWPNHKVDYFIRSRNIKPVQRAGNLRIFSKKVVSKIMEESEPNPHPQTKRDHDESNTSW